MPLNVSEYEILSRDARMYEQTNIVRAGLVLHLDASIYNTVSFGSTWFDLSGNGNNGTLTNGPTYSSNDGGIIDFDGSNDYVNAGSINLQQNFSLEAWIKMDDNTSFEIFGQGTFSTNQGLHILYTSGSRGMIYGMFANDNDYQNNYRPSVGQWYHWVFTYNHSTYNKQFYADTVLQTPGSSVENAYAGSGQFNIGATYSSPNGYGDGKFSIVRMYNRVLSATEIAHNYNVTKGRFGL